MPPKRQHPPAGESATVPESRPAVEFATGSAQAFFEAAFALATDGQVVVDPETLKPLLFNDAACVPYGYSREQFATLQIPQVSEPDVPDTMEIVIARLLEFGETRFNSTARTMSGDVRYLHVWARTIDFAGRPAFHAVFRDVTAEHLVQDALRRSHDLLERTGRLASVGGWQIDLATQALHWTPEVYRIHDLEPGTPIAIAEAIDYYAPEARPVIAAAVQAAIDLGTSFDLELPMITARGRRILVRAQGAAERRDGKTTHLHGAFQDVTDRRQGEESRRLQSAALQAAADAIVITDREGTIEWVNEAFSKLTGFSADEAMGRNPRDLVRSGEHPSEFYGELWATIVAGRSWQGELVNRRKDGTTYHEDQTITPILDDAGAITHFVAIKRDITQRLKLEAQLRQSQKMEAVGRLAGGIAHDFNNLLTVITATASSCIAELASDDPVRADVVEMIAAGRRAAALTRQLLAFSRRQLLAPTVLDLNTVVASLEQLLRRLLGEDIELWPSPRRQAWPASRLTPAQMEQVIMNLAVNARDAMPDGGKLSIEPRAMSSSMSSTAATWGSTCRSGPYVHAGGERHRHRHGRDDAEPDLRAVLHHQGRWARAPASAWRRSTASSSRVRGSSGSYSEPGRGYQLHGSTCRRSRRLPTPNLPPRKWARRLIRKPFCWSRTSPSLQDRSPACSSTAASPFWAPPPATRRCACWPSTRRRSDSCLPTSSCRR